MATSIEVFPDDADGIEGVALILREASIVEYEGELVPGCKLTAAHAMHLAAALARCAKEIE